MQPLYVYIYVQVHRHIHKYSTHISTNYHHLGGGQISFKHKMEAVLFLYMFILHLQFSK